MVMGTRNNPTHETNTEAASLAVRGQGTAETKQAVPTLQQSPIMDLISDDLEALSQEGKAIVSTIVKALTLSMQEKDQTIQTLKSKVSSLESKVTKLEDQLDDIYQYERRDTIKISGPALPQEQAMENTSDLAVKTIKDNLHINIEHKDINITHRLGPKHQNKTRPIIVKLINRSKKTEILEACVTVRPNIYVNESLTPKRHSIYTTILEIRKKHRSLFQQCYTRDGRIYVKLRNSNQKHIITNEHSLNTFLDKFLILNQV